MLKVSLSVSFWLLDMRDLINIITEAVSQLKLPSPIEVFPDEEINEIATHGFCVGVPYGAAAGNDRDVDSITRFFDEMLEDGEYEDGDDEIAFLANWLRGERYQYITRKLRASIEMQNGLVKIHREIVIPDNTIGDIVNGRNPHLGEFWSFNNPEGHWARAGDNDHNVILTALVKPKDIDWVTTIRRNANWTLGDDENEITLRHGTPLHLIEMLVNGKAVEIKVPEQYA